MCDVCHTLGTELVELGIGGRFVITLLVGGREHFRVRSNNVVLQLAHSLELHAGHFVEGAACLAQSVLGRTLQRFSVLVEIGAKHGQGRDLGKGIQEGRAETWQDIEVAAACLDEGEQAAAVHTLAACQYGIQICQVVYHEVQCLQPAVAGGIHEVHHPDVVLFDEADDVRLCEFLARFAQEGYQFVGIHGKFLVHSSIVFCEMSMSAPSCMWAYRHKDSVFFFFFSPYSCFIGKKRRTLCPVRALKAGI